MTFRLAAIAVIAILASGCYSRLQPTNSEHLTRLAALCGHPSILLQDRTVKTDELQARVRRPEGHSGWRPVCATERNALETASTHTSVNEVDLRVFNKGNRTALIVGAASVAALGTVVVVAVYSLSRSVGE